MSKYSHLSQQEKDDLRRAYFRQWYADHREQCKQYQREYKIRHPKKRKIKTVDNKFYGPKPINPIKMVQLPVEQLLRLFKKWRQKKVDFVK
jgi:hypothetical protein